MLSMEKTLPFLATTSLTIGPHQVKIAFLLAMKGQRLVDNP
jgi:hypothetical protein